MQSWLLFYIGSNDNAIKCAEFEANTKSEACTGFYGLESAKHVVAADSRHLYVSLLPPTEDLLMVYEDPSGKVNVMHGSTAFATRAFEWHNMTEDLEVIINDRSPGSYLTTTCIADKSLLYCFAKDSTGSAAGLYEIGFSIASGNLTFTDGNLSIRREKCFQHG